MFKKIYVPVILALVAALVFSNVAYAATDSTAAKTYIRRLGTISSVDTANNTIRVAATQGGTMTFHVNTSTVYRGNASSFTDLASGMYVNIKAEQLSNGAYLAVIVNALNTRVTGKVTGFVTAVGDSSFAILGSDGNTYTLQVTKKTTFSGQEVVDLSGLAVGMKVKVNYTKSGDLYRAQTVVVTLVTVKLDGKVTKINDSSFNLLATDGTTYSLQVTSNTSFTGLGVESFGQLAKGMKVRVTYTVREDGTLRAVKVIVRKLAS
jgi:serine/threonine protein phosphatase PrpC